MKVPAAILGVAFAVWAWAGPAPTPARAESLTVATYNVENYVAASRVTEVGYRKDYPKPEVQKRALRAAIRALGADVLVLQEMGPQPYLDELQRDLRQEGVDYPYAVLLAAADPDRHVAMLSRRPLAAVVPHTDLTLPYFGERVPVKRGLLEVRLALAAGDVVLFALHLKSRYTDRPDDPQSALRRVGEAAAIRDRILARAPDPAAAWFVVLGDCNDSKNSKTVRRLQARGKMPIATLLPAADSRGEAWTYRFRGEDTYTRVDHILVSPGLVPWVRGGSATIADGAEVLAASDHRPVVVRFDFSGQKKGGP